MSIVTKTCHHHAMLQSVMLRGGRMTKFKGQAASYAPLMGAVVSALAMGASLVFASPALAQSTCGDGATVASGGTCNLNANGYDPTTNDNQVGATKVNGGDAVTVQGPWTAPTGDGGYTLVTLKTIPGITPDPNVPDLQFGPQTQGVATPDPITGGTTTVATYNSANFSVQNNGDLPGALPYDVNNQQYINLRIGTVASSGGALNVNIGNPANAPDATGNAMTLAAKQTDLVYVDGTGSTPSTANWTSRNQVLMSAGQVTGSTETGAYWNVPTYAGTFTAFDGSTQNVTDAASLAAYNDFLVQSLKTGALNSQSAYNSAFNQAVTIGNVAYSYPNNVTPGDEVTDPVTELTVMHGVGPNATLHIAAGGQIDYRGMNVVESIKSPAILAESGAHFINDGQLSGDYLLVSLQSGAKGLNNGVISSGYASGNNFDTSGSAKPNNFGTGSYTEGYGVDARDAGTTFTNKGIMNVASWDYAPIGDAPGLLNFGIAAGGGATASNAGIINVGVNQTSLASQVAGALVSDANSSFTNEATGTIYIGRAAQYNVAAPETVTDIAQSNTSYGIALYPAGTATNLGNITIGTLAQNATGMVARPGSSGTLTNSGTIDVNGAAPGIPLQNIGMLADSSSAVVTNDANGVINLNGTNGVGIKVVSNDGIASSATSNGTINVAGGADPTSGTRNFGIWAEGNSALASATVNGPINLTGVGGIGVHARGLANVTVSANAVPNFVSGSDQIGFYIYGPDATVAVASSTMDVSTDRSTLFRIAEGADLNASGLTITTSGANSTGIVGSGAGTLIDAGTGTFNVSGAGAQAVQIEGGAQGTIDAGTTITLTGVGSTAGIVDGQKHDLSGNPVGAPDPTTSLTSAAALTSSLDQVTGYVAENQGQLTNSGSITLTGAHTTGIEVETGATANNTGNISITDGGVGISVASGSSGLLTTANNTGSLTVNGGSMVDRTRGVAADGVNAVANVQTGSTLTLNGVGAIGAQALNGGQVSVSGTALPVFNNSDQIAFDAAGAGSVVTSTATALDASGLRSTMFRIEDGANLNATGLALTASGAYSTGIVGTGVGTNIVTGTDTFNLTGTGATAVSIDGGATGVIGAASSVTLAAPGTVAGIVDGRKVDLAGVASATTYPSLLTNNAMIDSSADNAVGFVTQYGGTLVNNGVIDLTSGVNNTGVIARSGGIFTNNADITVANGTGLLVEGAGSASQLSNNATIAVNNGIAGIDIRDGAYLTADNSTGNVVAGGTAHGVLVDTGATGVQLGANTITVTGTGNGIENAAEVSAIGFTGTTINVGNGAGIRTGTAIDPNATVTINVAGSGDGFAFRYADGSATASDLALGSGYVINANGVGATGIRLNTTGNLDTSAIVTVSNPTGGSALVGGPANQIVNRGSLISASTVAPTVDLTGGTMSFVNTGTITAASGGTAILGGNQNLSVYQQAGSITGTVDLGAGNDLYNQTGGTVNGSILGGNGNDTFIWTGGNWSGAFRGGNGSDTAYVSAAGYNGSQILDGGDDTSTADGMIDKLTLNGITATVNGANLTNWEVINLVNSNITANSLVAGTVNTCGGSITLGGSSVVGSVLGCATKDTITVTDNTVVTGSIQGAGGSDTINVLGNASVGSVMGGGAGQDGSAAQDSGNVITIGTTGKVGLVDGGSGNDHIILNKGTIGAVQGGDGNDVIDWNSAAAKVTSIDGGQGSDTLNINDPAISLAGVTLNGGDDASSADGMNDTLNLNGWSGKLTGANTINWEVLNINGGTVGISDGAITAGVINVNAGGTLDGSNNLMANADVAISGGSTLISGNAAGTNAMQITGSLANAGTVDLRGPAGQQAPGDRLTVGGNYVGTPGSKLVLDTALGGSNSPTDMLVVKGNVSGSTALVVNNVGGKGALTTGSGIKVVQVGGTSAPGSFALANGAVDVGAFRYKAYEGSASDPSDNSWYLRSQARDIVAPTVALAHVATDLGLTMLGTLHERVGEQEHLGLQPSVQSGAGKGMWARMIGKDYTDTAKSSAFGDMRSVGQYGGMEMGIDLYRGAQVSGARTLVGVYGGHMWSGTTEHQVTPQAFIAGTTHSDGWTAGLYATRYAASGLYVDAVVQGSWLNHKASGTDGTTLRTKSDNWLASLEVGKPFSMGSAFMFEPQAQLIYGNTKLDAAQDSTNVLNTFNVQDSLTGRAGFRIKRTWDYNPQSEGGLFTAYLKANVWSTLAGGGSSLTVGVSDPGSTRYRKAWGDVGFGSTFSLSSRAEFYEDTGVEFGLDQKSTALTGHVGFRFRF